MFFFLCHVRLYALESYRIGWLAGLLARSLTTSWPTHPKCFAKNEIVCCCWLESVSFSISLPFSFFDNSVCMECDIKRGRESHNQKVHITIITYSHGQQVLIAAHTHTHAHSYSGLVGLFSTIAWLNPSIFGIYSVLLMTMKQQSGFRGGRFFTCFKVACDFPFALRSACIRGALFAGRR